MRILESIFKKILDSEEKDQKSSLVERGSISKIIQSVPEIQKRNEQKKSQQQQHQQHDDSLSSPSTRLGSVAQLENLFTQKWNKTKNPSSALLSLTNSLLDQVFLEAITNNSANASQVFDILGKIWTLLSEKVISDSVSFLTESLQFISSTAISQNELIRMMKQMNDDDRRHPWFDLLSVTILPVLLRSDNTRGDDEYDDENNENHFLSETLQEMLSQRNWFDDLSEKFSCLENVQRIFRRLVDVQFSSNNNNNNVMQDISVTETINLDDLIQKIVDSMLLRVDYHFNNQQGKDENKTTTTTTSPATINNSIGASPYSTRPEHVLRYVGIQWILVKFVAAKISSSLSSFLLLEKYSRGSSKIFSSICVAPILNVLASSSSSSSSSPQNSSSVNSCEIKANIRLLHLFNVMNDFVSQLDQIDQQFFCVSSLLSSCDASQVKIPCASLLVFPDHDDDDEDAAANKNDRNDSHLHFFVTSTITALQDYCTGTLSQALKNSSDFDRFTLEDDDDDESGEENSLNNTTKKVLGGALSLFQNNNNNNNKTTVPNKSNGTTKKNENVHKTTLSSASSSSLASRQAEIAFQRILNLNFKHSSTSQQQTQQRKLIRPCSKSTSFFLTNIGQLQLPLFATTCSDLGLSLVFQNISLLRPKITTMAMMTPKKSKQKLTILPFFTKLFLQKVLREVILGFFASRISVALDACEDLAETVGATMRSACSSKAKQNNNNLDDDDDDVDTHESHRELFLLNQYISAILIRICFPLIFLERIYTKIFPSCFLGEEDDGDTNAVVVNKILKETFSSLMKNTEKRLSTEIFKALILSSISGDDDTQAVNKNNFSSSENEYDNAKKIEEIKQRTGILKERVQDVLLTFFTSSFNDEEDVLARIFFSSSSSSSDYDNDVSPQRRSEIIETTWGLLFGSSDVSSMPERLSSTLHELKQKEKEEDEEAEKTRRVNDPTAEEEIENTGKSDSKRGKNATSDHSQLLLAAAFAARLENHQIPNSQIPQPSQQQKTPEHPLFSASILLQNSAASNDDLLKYDSTFDFRRDESVKKHANEKDANNKPSAEPVVKNIMKKNRGKNAVESLDLTSNDDAESENEDHDFKENSFSINDGNNEAAQQVKETKKLSSRPATPIVPPSPKQESFAVITTTVPKIQNYEMNKNNINPQQDKNEDSTSFNLDDDDVEDDDENSRESKPTTSIQGDAEPSTSAEKKNGDPPHDNELPHRNSIGSSLADSASSLVAPTPPRSNMPNHCNSSFATHDTTSNPTALPNQNRILQQQQHHNNNNKTIPTTFSDPSLQFPEASDAREGSSSIPSTPLPKAPLPSPSATSAHRDTNVTPLSSSPSSNGTMTNVAIQSKTNTCKAPPIRFVPSPSTTKTAVTATTTPSSTFPVLSSPPNPPSAAKKIPFTFRPALATATTTASSGTPTKKVMTVIPFPSPPNTNNKNTGTKTVVPFPAARLVLSGNKNESSTEKMETLTTTQKKNVDDDDDDLI